jgi:hypothetical protein
MSLSSYMTIQALSRGADTGRAEVLGDSELGPVPAVGERQGRPGPGSCRSLAIRTGGSPVQRPAQAEPGANCSARLVAVTGYGQEEDRRRSREAGFDLHLTKPVDPEELKRVLAAAPAGSMPHR